MNLSVFVLLTLVFLPTSYASIPDSKRTASIERVLNQNDEYKFTYLKTLGPQVYKDLRQITFDSRRELDIRWKAFMAMVRIGEKESMPEVQKALKSSEWYLRNAALRVLPALDAKEAYTAALGALNDSALVVRTAAVDTLALVNNANCSDKLWIELYQKRNYIGEQSLWIRRHIVEALAKIAVKGSEEKFVKVLDDKDKTLYSPAIKGLERVTGKKFGSSDIPPTHLRFYWKKWFVENKSKEI